MNSVRRPLPALDVVVRRTIFEQPVVIARIALTPTGVGVVPSLIRQHWLIVVDDIDLAVVVRALPFPIHVTEPIAARFADRRVLASIAPATRTGNAGENHDGGW
jgi:hypothetical protein